MQATAIASGMDRVGDVPGLKSEAMARAAPASSNAETGGGLARRNSVDAGSSTAAVRPDPRAFTPSALTWLRWSALRVPSVAAASAAPDPPSWSAWHRTGRPARAAAAATAARSSTENAMSST